MSTRQLNLLNIFLMIASLGAALAFPVQLFILAYAIVGPLHYLTELAWLDKRTYFLPERRQAYALYVLGFVTLITLLVPQFYSPSLPLISLGLAALFVFPRNKPVVAGVLVAGAAYALGIGRLENLVLLLPTLIHVCCFTAIFIFIGAIRSRDATAYLSLLTFGTCLAVIAILSPAIPHWEAGEGMRAANQTIAPWIALPLLKLFQAQDTESSRLLCQRVIAFSYCYHYLNWFSKTGVIQWHRIPRRRLALVLAVYALTLAFYCRSFYLGFLVSYLLSIGHVYLEFPLNVRSVAELLALARPRAATAATAPRA